MRTQIYGRHLATMGKLRRRLMKWIRSILLFSLSCLFYPLVALAQNGAFIERGDLEVGGFEWDGDQTLVIYSSYSNLDCEPGGVLLEAEYMAVIRPDETIKYHDSGDYFTRVYYPATPDDILPPEENLCSFWDTGPIVAEGILHSIWNDNDAYGTSERRKIVWGYNLSGTLYDRSGECPSGMVDLNVIRRWTYRTFKCKDDCFTEQVIKGPRLECVE